MDPRSPRTRLHAPGFGASPAEPPPLDAHVVEPEGRDELLRGRTLYASPSLPEHGDPHHRIDVVVGTHIARDRVGSTDLLTRVADDGDFATDTSVRRAGVDPATGQRYLEEMVFEVVNTQRLSEITAKAEELAARGVRRIFAVFVRKGVVSEWCVDAWSHLAPDAEIEDECLAAPIRVSSLLEASELGGAAVRGLLARNEPALVELLRTREAQGVAQGVAQGEARGDLAARRETLRALLDDRGLARTPSHDARIDGCDDPATLRAWTLRAASAASADQVFA